MTSLQLIDESNITPYQILIIFLCVLINLFEGFTLLAMSYAAPSISEHWNLEPETLGVVFTAAFLGMAVGALVLAPLSDYIGRRKTILICIFIISIASFLTAMSDSLLQLLAFRLLTGIGIGGSLPSITTMAAEYSPDRFRNLTVSIVHVANPIGAVLGGMTAVMLIDQYGWSSVFIVAGILTIIVGLLTYLYLPESLEFLLSRQPNDGIKQLNKILSKLKQAKIEEWPASPTIPNSKKTGIGVLLNGEYAKWSVLMWISFFMMMFGVYFILSWLPKIVVNAGLPMNQAIYIGIMISAGGIIGLLWMGYQSARTGIRKLVIIFEVLSIVLVILFGFAPVNVYLLSGIAFFLGLFAQGGLIGLYIAAVRLYDANVRTTGLGWGLGLGRFGAILSPVVVGFIIGSGWPQWLLFLAMSSVFLIAACAMSMLDSERLGIN